jgi:TonB family protein
LSRELSGWGSTRFYFRSTQDFSPRDIATLASAGRRYIGSHAEFLLLEKEDEDPFNREFYAFADLLSGAVSAENVAGTPATAVPDGVRATIAPSTTLLSPDTQASRIDGAVRVTADDYPPISLRLMEQGTVEVRVLVGTDGLVKDFELITTSGRPRLDEAAFDFAIRRFRYKPATSGGDRIDSWVNETVVFALAP